MYSFDFFSYSHEVNFGSINIGFEKDHLYLRDGNQTDYSDHEVYCFIDKTEFPQIIPLITVEYKNECILKEYKGASTFFEKLTNQEEKLLFLFFLHFFKSDSLNNFINNTIKMLKDNDINFTRKETFY
jgi:hypothetical protein